jgi:hypothetical protein
MIPNSNENPSVSLIRKGLRRAWAGAVWMYKIIIPVSFLTFLISFSHILEHLEGVLGPVMGLLHLPSKAAMPLIAGMLTGIYGGIAAMAVLSFTIKETTLIAVFLLISHALIQESTIQGNSGLHPLKATVFRIVMSATVVGLLGLFWHGGQQANPLLGLATVGRITFMGALGNWCVKTLVLSLQILAILVVIMTANEWMKARHLAERLARFLKPLLRMMGLNEDVGLLWLTAMLFGITYGGAVIVEEVRKGTLSAGELESLHLSIGINHAVIEDPALFLPLGVHPLWLWVPRWVAALIAVHLLRLWRRYGGRTVKKKLVSEEKAY